jgi:hypothetical protein
MLPDFPDLKRRWAAVAGFEVRRHVKADELVGAIRAVPYFEGRGFRTGDVDGFVDETTPTFTAIPYVIARQDIIEKGVTAFIEASRRAAEAQVGAFQEMLLRKNTEVVERVGNRIDAGGQPFSADLYFKMLETVQIDFDSNGRPDISGTRLVVHPEQADRIRQLFTQWERDEAFQERYRQIMLKKREEWRDRQSNRRLVD